MAKRRKRTGAWEKTRSRRARAEARISAAPRYVFTAFFLSGFAGLMHQVVWAKLLVGLIGTTAHAQAAVLAVFINDPLERKLPPPGRYRIVSPDDELSIDTYATAARRDYENEFAERSNVLEKFCHRYGVHLMPMSTDDDPVSTLQTALGRRSH